MHPNSKRTRPTKPRLFLVHTITTTRASTIRAYAFLELPTPLHFVWSTRIELRATGGHDSGRLSCLRRHEGFHRYHPPNQELQAEIHEWIWSWWTANDAVSTESGIRFANSRSVTFLMWCGLGIVQQTWAEPHVCHPRLADQVLS